MAGLSLSILPISALVAQSKPERERRQLHRTQAHQFVLILAGWIVCAFGLHTADAISLGLAPSGTELLNSYGSVTKLGLGVVVGVMLVLIKTSVVILGFFVLVAEYWIAHLLVAFWPLFCAFRGSPIKSLQSFGDIGISTFGTLLLLKVFQSGVLRFLYELEWTLGSGDQLVASVVATSVGLGIALVGAPILFMKKVIPSGMMILGGSLKQKPEEAADRVRNRATDSAKEYAASARSRVTSTDRSPASDASSGTNSRPSSSGSSAGSTNTSSGGFETLADKFSTDNDNE
ncbi:hypothetical protein SAMN04487948_14210 [Halogranum amylolyticum]|uniref:Uncharacterized protein n=2 Tax=Halogranum amylolyticum TaxID=660520 RepID=A0A1H8WTL0_9EURY|nr:hypothetical protein SAMN04487948_14210 [Halogranum amylolyticum]